MIDPIEARRADDSDVAGRARLEEALVEAHYLGHALRALAADPDFGFRQITASVCEPLIAWAKFVEARLEAGERPFGPDRRARRRK
jgi:hypothetical protein